jgi:hypothetical protein
MATPQRASKKTPVHRASAPAASRPRIPAVYGIPRHDKGLLSWSHVSDRLATAMHYWVSTVSPDGRPHATPVDGVWLDDQLFFGGDPQTRRSRNLAANPAVCIHLESGSDVVILEGDAPLRTVDRALAIRLAEASTRKYGYAPSPDDYAASGVHVFRPRVVFAWKQFPQDATRWRFPNAS